MRNDEITHHGILGQKWGIRRYQRKDGTLTPLGKKRIKNDDNDARSILSKMSDDELRKKTERLNLEKNYIEANNNIERLVPKKKSVAKKIIKDVWDKTIEPATLEAGKTVLKAYLTKTGAQMLNLNIPDDNDKKKKKK